MSLKQKEITKFLKKFGDQSLILPFKDRNKKETDFPQTPKTLQPKNVSNTFGKMNAEGDFGLFFLVNETNHPTKRKLANISRCRAIWVEDDTTGKKRTDFPVPPNIIVNSSPGKYHYYWLTDTTDTDEHQRVMQHLVNNFNCDPNARDISRVLRIPGTYHNKKKEPFLVTAEYIVDAPYTWETLKDAFPPEAKVLKETHSENEKGEYGFDYAKTVKALITGENFHGSMISIALHHANNGLNKKQIEKELLALLPICVDQEKAQERFSEHHLNECIETALRKVFEELPEMQDDVEIKRDFNISSEKLEHDVLMPPNTIFGEMVKTAYESGYRRNLMAGFLGAAATVAYLGGGKYILEGEKLKLSIQQIGLGRSGVGKDPIVSTPAEFIDAAFLGKTPFDDLYDVLSSNMSRVIGSRQGIENTLRNTNKHDFMLALDEIGDFIGSAISAKNATSSSEMMTFLLEIFSSGATYSGRKLASSKNNPDALYKTLFSPTVTLTGASTPEKFSQRMGGSYVSHGSAARIVIQNCDLYAESAVKGRKQLVINSESVSDKVKDQLVKISDQSVLVKGDLGLPLPQSRASSPIPIAMNTEVSDLFFDFGEWANEEEGKAGAVGAIWNRAGINAKLYAMIFAVTENPIAPVIELYMAKNAIAIVHASLDYQSELFDDSMMAETVHSRINGAIISSLKRNKRSMSRKELSDSSNAIKSASPMDRRNAFNELVEDQIIEERTFRTKSAKKPTTTYALTELGAK